MTIEIINVSKPEWVNKGRSKWQTITVSYLENGETKGKKIASFGESAEVFAKLTNGFENGHYDVEQVKNDKGYWNWTNLVKASGGASAPSEGSPAKKSWAPNKTDRDWETKEERALKQKLITRQNAVGNAVGILTAGAKSPPDIVEVLAAAEKIEAWVNRPSPAMDAIINEMDDDVPL